MEKETLEGEFNNSFTDYSLRGVIEERLANPQDSECNRSFIDALGRRRFEELTGYCPNESHACH